MTAADCPGVPPGGDAPAACADLIVGGALECYISCETDENCPTGMECAFGQACVWPADWTCSLFFYDDLDCDCGCGIPDSAGDCADAMASTCDFCDDIGSCSTAVGCPGDIDTNNNAICI